MNRSAIGVLLLRVLGAAMTYVFVICMARIMDIGDFGRMGSVLSASLLLSVLASYGQQQALVRFIPPLAAQGKSAEIASLILHALSVVLWGNAVLTILLGLGLLAGALSGKATAPWVLALGLVIIPLTSLVDFQAYLARAYKGILIAVVPKDVLWRLISLVILVVLAVSGGHGMVSLTTVFAVLVAVLATIVVVNVSALSRLYSIPRLTEILRHREAQFDFKGWKRSNFAFWITSVSSVAFANIDVVVVSVLINPVVGALYFSANRIAQAPAFFQQSYNVVVSPIFAELAATGNAVELKRTVLQATRFTFIPTAMVAGFLAALSGPVLQLFGPEFLAARPMLLILLVTAVSNVAFGQTDLLLTMAGHERTAMKISMWSTLLGTGFIVLGTLLFQGTGAAIGSLAAITLRKVWFWEMAKRRLDIQGDILAALKSGVWRR